MYTHINKTYTIQYTMNISIASSDRKISKRSTVPGVIGAKFKSAEDKSKIMAAKPQLQNSRIHSNVFINHDQSLQERKSASNLKAIVDAVNRGDKLSLRGSRVFSNSARPAYNTSSNHNANTKGQRSMTQSV